MLRRVLSIVVMVLAWCVIIAYMLFASHLSKRYRSEQVVEDVVVRIVDSTATRQFVSSADITRKLRRAGFRFEKQPVDSIDVVSAVNYLRKSGYIDDVDMYVTSSGSVVVDIDQHEPLVRFMTDGYSSYITRDRHTFCTPRGSAYYAPVITGSFKPLFVPNFEGSIDDRYRALMEEQDKIEQGLISKYRSLRQKERECASRKKELRDSRKKNIFESKERYKLRLIGVKQEIEKCDAESRELKAQRLKIESRQSVVEQRRERLTTRYNDFCRLLDFVAAMEEDGFWGAEIVQYVADTTSQGDISLRLIPRSGRFAIEFGTLTAAEPKLDKLRKFYDDGLSNMGWERFSKIDVKYNNQVICTE